VFVGMQGSHNDWESSGDHDTGVDVDDDGSGSGAGECHLML